MPLLDRTRISRINRTGRAWAAGGGARRRAAPRRNSKAEPVNATPSFLELGELDNVNVFSLPENTPPADARTREEAADVETQSSPPAAEPGGLPGSSLAQVPPGPAGAGGQGSQASAAPAPNPNDGFDPELAKTHVATSYKVLIARMTAQKRAGKAWELTMAKWLLEARQVAAAAASPSRSATAPAGSMGPPPASSPESPPPGGSPPKIAPPVSKPSITELAGRLYRGIAGPGPIEELATRLAEDLHDKGSVSFFRRIAERVRRKEVTPEMVARAYRTARSDGVRSPGRFSTRRFGSSNA